MTFFDRLSVNQKIFFTVFLKSSCSSVLHLSVLDHSDHDPRTMITAERKIPCVRVSVHYETIDQYFFYFGGLNIFFFFTKSNQSHGLLFSRVTIFSCYHSAAIFKYNVGTDCQKISFAPGRVSIFLSAEFLFFHKISFLHMYRQIHASFIKLTYYVPNTKTVCKLLCLVLSTSRLRRKTRKNETAILVTYRTFLN